MKTALYSRVSTESKQDAMNQLLQLRQFAASQNWEVVHEFIDQESGGTGDRTKFQELFRAASRHEFSLALFWSLDRFGRQGTRETINQLYTLNSYGVAFRSYTEPFLDLMGPLRDAIIGLLAALAEMERKRIVDRVKAGQQRYQADYENGIIGKMKHSKSGRDLPPGRPKRIFDRQQVLQLRKQGLSLNKISEILKVGRGTVERALAAFPKIGEMPNERDAAN